MSAAPALGVVADVHGNRWALEAVLAELDRRGVSEVVDLGDCLYGPLDPAGTLELLRACDWPTVRGNQDRALVEPDPAGGETLTYVLAELADEGVSWLARHTRAPFAWHGIFACHGTPDDDATYLLEVVEPGGVVLRSPEETAGRLGAVFERVVACAHSHVPRLVRDHAGRVVLNPGSVGLPAYDDDAPHPHRMESGSPHARFAIVHADERGPRVEHVAVPYDHERAAVAATRRGRDDWARWIRSGVAR